MKTAIFAAFVGLLPHGASADVLELSQSQMRQLVVQQQVLSAETVVDGAARNFGGVVMDIRGFLSEGQMTYRLLMQRNDGSVIEVLVNGVNGHQVAHNTNMGQVVSAVAKSTNGSRNGSNEFSSTGSRAETSTVSNTSGNSNRGINASNTSNRSSNASSNSNRDNSSNNRGGNGNGKKK